MSSQEMAASLEKAMVLSARASSSVGATVPVEVKACLADVRAKAKALEESAFWVGNSFCFV